jgi:uncharacterized protein (DUF488 family)
MPEGVLFTIGFTKKSAEVFFDKIKNAGVKKVIDIRLNNISQLSGFAKRDDLKYFLRILCNCGYSHEPSLTPTKDILDDYRKRRIGWPEYVRRFSELMEARAIKDMFTIEELTDACLLCTEPTAEKCHRGVVADYFKRLFPGIEVIHL